MITVESAEDMLDADSARRSCGRAALLTHDGFLVLTRLVGEMKRAKKTQVDRTAIEIAKT